MKRKFILIAVFVTLFFSPFIVANANTENGWVIEGGKTYYYENGKMVHGFKEINGKTYFFGITKGALLTGWQDLPEGRFYLYEDGSIKQGWQEIEGKTYYVENNYITKGFKEIEGKTYFFGITKGALLTGWQELPEGRFYLYEDGSIKQGWQEIEGKTYYVENNYIARGFKEIEEKTYFFGITKGALLTGWQELPEGRFYLYEDGSIKQGWQEIEEKTYYVENNYIARGFKEIEGKTYFFGITKGALLTGWQELPEGRFYLYEDGSIKQGWQEIDGKTYYVKDKYIVRGTLEIDGTPYQFNKETGVLVSGLYIVDNNQVFIIDENGNRLYGWQEVDGKKYYIAEDGYAVHDFYTIDGVTYFFGMTKGALLTGWQELPEGRFYLYEDGSVKQGWQEIEGKTYYVENNYLVRGFKEIEGKTYFFGLTKGALLTGWQNLTSDNLQIFYSNMDGTVVFGNQTVDGRDYAFGEDGFLDGFIYQDGSMFYYNPDGSLATGIQRIAGRYYQFNEITGAFEKYVNQRIVIDVSAHQEDIDWEAVKNSGLVDAVILRAGYGVSWMDTYFLHNVSELNRLGIPYSVYLFSYAENGNEASMEADNLINIIKNSQANIASNIFSIYYDLEDWHISSTGESSDGITQSDYETMYHTFANKVESALGVEVKIYASKNFIETRFPSSLRPYVGWVAQWGPQLTYQGTYEGWQYTSDGSVPGINGRVDMNIFYY